MSESSNSLASPKKLLLSENKSFISPKIISRDLDLKKSGMVVAGASTSRASTSRQSSLGLARGLSSIGGMSSRNIVASSTVSTPSTLSQRHAEVQQRLRKQEEVRRQQMVHKMREDQQKQMRLEKRREDMKKMMQERRKEKEESVKAHQKTALQMNQNKQEDVVNKVSRREKAQMVAQRRLQAQKEQQEAKALEAMVVNMKKRQQKTKARERADAEAKLRRRKDADLRHQAAKALWDRQELMLDAIKQRNRVELERLLSVPQPHLTARMPKYNFMEYPANRTMRRLLHEFQRKRLDEVTFNQEAEELVRRMSPRRILLHQNQLLREEEAVNSTEAASGSLAKFVEVSTEPLSRRTRLTWWNSPRHQPQAGALAEQLTDEVLGRADSLYSRLLQLSSVDVTALLRDPVERSFDDTGDLDQTISAFDFGSDLHVDAEAAARIQKMYREQACRMVSARHLRRYPSQELQTFSSAVMDVGVTCSCTTLSGVDSQCSLCMLDIVKREDRQQKNQQNETTPQTGKMMRAFRGLKRNIFEKN